MSPKRRRHSGPGPLSGLTHLLLAPFRWLSFSFRSVMEQARARSRRKARPVRPGILGWMSNIADLILLPFIVIFQTIWYFIVEWTSSRSTRGLLAAAPSVFVAIVMMSAIGYAHFSPKDGLAVRYELAAEKAIRDEKYEDARIYLEKLTTLKPGEDRYLFGVAKMLENEGNISRAYGIMQSLAPIEYESASGYSEAHRWLAIHMLNQQVEDVDAMLALRATAKQHLRAAIRSDDNNHNAKLQLATLLLQDGGLDEGLELYGELASVYPVAAYQYGVILRQVGRQDDAMLQVASARAIFEEKVRSEPQKIENWIMLHQCLVFQGEFDQALLTLDRARTEAPHDNIDVAKAAVLVARCNDYRQRGVLRENIENVVRDLEYALSLAPNYEPALRFLTVIVDLPEFSNDEAMASLQDRLIDSNAPAMVHMLLGTKYAQQSNNEQALFHFERALQLNGRMSPVLNNMAWVLANIRVPDETDEERTERLTEALGLINQAIDIDADRLTYYDTRGQIYLLMGDFRSALNDLETALPEMRNQNARYHDSLATCYRQLNQPEMAERHQLRADSIREQNQTPQ